MMVSMGKEIILGLCFGFVLNRVMIMEGFFLLLLLQRGVLYRANAFSAFCTVMLGKRLGVPEGLGGDTASTGDPNWPKKCSRPCDIVLSI